MLLASLICSGLALAVALYTLFTAFKAKQEYLSTLAAIRKEADSAIASQAWAESCKANLEEVVQAYHQAIARHN